MYYEEEEEEEREKREMECTWVIVKRVFLQFLFVDATKAVLVQEPL